jgi:hypothetical protein
VRSVGGVRAMEAVMVFALPTVLWCRLCTAYGLYSIYGLACTAYGLALYAFSRMLSLSHALVSSFSNCVSGCAVS